MPELTPLESLRDMWKEDSKFDTLDPGTELGKIGSLHSKYLTILSMNRQSMKVLEKQQAKLKKLKWEYYTGKLDETTLKKFNWEPFPYILKSDIQLYLEADKDMQTLKTTYEVHEEIVDLCTSILKEVNSRTWQAKEIVAWARFTAGC